MHLYNLIFTSESLRKLKDVKRFIDEHKNTRSKYQEYLIDRKDIELYKYYTDYLYKLYWFEYLIIYPTVFSFILAKIRPIEKLRYRFTLGISLIVVPLPAFIYTSRINHFIGNFGEKYSQCELFIKTPIDVEPGIVI